MDRLGGASALAAGRGDDDDDQGLPGRPLRRNHSAWPGKARPSRPDLGAEPGPGPASPRLLHQGSSAWPGFSPPRPASSRTTGDIQVLDQVSSRSNNGGAGSGRCKERACPGLIDRREFLTRRPWEPPRWWCRCLRRRRTVLAAGRRCSSPAPTLGGGPNVGWPEQARSRARASAGEGDRLSVRTGEDRRRRRHQGAGACQLGIVGRSRTCRCKSRWSEDRLRGPAPEAGRRMLRFCQGDRLPALPDRARRDHGPQRPVEDEERRCRPGPLSAVGGVLAKHDVLAQPGIPRAADVPLAAGVRCAAARSCRAPLARRRRCRSSDAARDSG